MPQVDYYRRHRNLLFTGAALLWTLALGLSSVLAQATTDPATSAPQAAADKEQCAHGDGQSDEKSKDCPAPPAYKLLRYDEDYSYHRFLGPHQVHPTLGQ
jgi:hypothetical protein